MFSVQSFTFSPLQENTYILYNESGECCIVDPGCYFGNERNQLKDFIEATALIPKYLLNTHCHLDHVFGNKFVHRTWQLLPHLHPLEKPVLEYAERSGQEWGLPFDNYTGEVVYIDVQDTIMLGEDQLSIILAPGHSPGSICFYCEAQQFVIGGDVLFRDSIGRSDLPGGDHATLLESIRRQLFTLPPEVVVYPGHGPHTTIGYEKAHNPFF